MIKPTIGRVVWLWPCAATHIDKGFAYSDKTMPLAATVAYVWSDRMVNLAVVDQNGKAFNLTSVLLLQGDEEYAPVGNYCEWMPYQKTQAEKAVEVTGDMIARVHPANVDELQAMIDANVGKPMNRDGSLADPDKFGVITVSADHPLDGIARVCHEVNRAYCQALGDMSQPAWEDAPAWQRESARTGVDLHSSGDFGPEASHISWMQQKLDEGWTYGPVKDADHKTHPCIRPFAELPPQQQAKDFIFRAIVHELRTTHRPV